MRLLKYMLPLMALLIWSATVSADYDPTSPPEPGDNFTLTIKSTPANSTRYLSPSTTHSPGSQFNVEAQANDGFRFIYWEDEKGDTVSTVYRFTYTMPYQHSTLTAHFEYNPDAPEEPGVPVIKERSNIYFEVTPKDAGSIYSRYETNPKVQTFDVDESPEFVANTNNNFRFINWTMDGEVISEERRFTYTVTSGDHHLVANFQYDPDSPEEPGEPHFYRTLTTKTNPEDAGTIYQEYSTALDGTSIRIYTRPRTYYTFINWTDDRGEVVSEESDIYFTMPNRNVVLTANYSYNYDPASPEEPGEPIPDGTIAENMVAYPRFGMFDDTHVMILCETEGSTIHYTIDGSDPTASSPVYTEPVFVPSNVLVKAIAFKEGMDDSAIRSYQVTTYKAIAPVFTFVNKKIEITSETPDAIIRYTLDYSEPNADSPIYTEAFVPEENCRVKAYASKEGLSDSKVSVFVYRRTDYTVNAPAFSLNADGKLVITPSVDGATTRYTYTPEGTEPDAESTEYTGPVTLDGNGIIKAYSTHINYFDSPVAEYVVEGFKVERPALSFLNPLLTISTATPNAQIRYTVSAEGAIPTAEDPLYSEPVRLSADGIVVARAFRANYDDSDTISFRYVYKDYMLPTPTANFADLHLTLSCEDAEAQLHYTLDGSEPTAESTLYEAPVALTEDCTVRFIAIRDHYNNSEVATFDFVRANYTAAAPTINYDSEAATITIATETEGAEIRYTIDGTVPTATTGEVYSEPIEVTCNRTYTAGAFHPTLFPSEPAVQVVDDRKAPTPTANFADLHLTLSCEDAEAQIRYTTDGSEPTAESTLYETPVALTEDCTVRFIAIRENYNNSDEATYEFARAEHMAAQPTFNYDSEVATITIATETEGAEIRYTIDGTAPTATTGEVYSEPIEVTCNRTYTAGAFSATLFPSETATLVVDDRKTPTPTATFADKVLTITCPDAEAQIRYTTDGSEPTAESTLYTGPIALTEDCTVRFIATRENYNNSDEASFVFVYTTYRVATPAFSYDAVNKKMTISCSTEGAEIRYTTDGSEPQAHTGLEYTGPVDVVGNVTFNARAFLDGLFDSAVAPLAITDQSVQTPTASFVNLRLIFSSEEEGDKIYYTTDGTDPTTESTLYTAPVALTQNCTVKFIATRENFNNSPMGSFDFVRSYYAVAKPEFTYDSEAGTIAIATTTEGAEIRYTTDETEPTATTGTVYTGPIAVTLNMTYYARAFHEGMFDSDLAEPLEVNDRKVSKPVAVFANRVLTLSCPEQAARIYYTTDGTEPTANSTLYEAPLALTTDCTVRYTAFLNGKLPTEGEPFIFIRDDRSVKRPVFNYDVVNKTVTITCSTQDAVIRYTTDGTDPTATTGTVYTGPIAITRNVTIKAGGFRSDLFDSEIATLSITDNTLDTPKSSFANKQLTLVCEDHPEAEIHYTLDGSVPTAASHLYTGPITLTEDCTVTFIAVLKDFNNSVPGIFVFKRSENSVDIPTFSYDTANRRMTISCATPNAEIRYTIDGSTPTATTGLAYTSPVEVIGNVTFKAIAIRSDLFDSPVATFSVLDQNVKEKPEARFENLRLILTCANEQAQIYYTLDGSVPTTQSNLYTGPVALTTDCKVKAVATLRNYNNSEVTEFDFKRADYTVDIPKFEYKEGIITITTDTVNAVIRYTIDGSEPTATTGTVYTDPITATRNVTYKARGFRDDLFDSDPAQLEVNDLKVMAPTATFANRVLTLHCPEEGAQIRYTTDGTEPTTASTLYEAPLALTQNCTVRYTAFLDGKLPTEGTPFTFVQNDWRVAAPNGTYHPATKKVTISCSTPDAQIRYTTDRSLPTATTGTVYTDSININGNVTITARGFRNDLFDSEPFVLVIDDQKAGKPTASYAAHAITLTRADEEDTIHYTIDGSAPTSSSPEYVAPIPVSSDCIVKFIATRPNYHNSDPDSIRFRLADYKEARATINRNFRERKVEITHANNLRVNVTINGETQSYSTPHTIGVDPSMSSMSVVAVAANDDRYDSDARTETIEFHQTPDFTYNGHTLSAAPKAGDSHRDQAQVELKVDGDSVQGSTVPIDYFCTVSGIVVSDAAFYSEPDSLVIDFYNTGKEAGVRNGHRLAEAFGTWGDSKKEYGNLIVKGSINRDDLALIATLPALTNLDLGEVENTAENCDSIFAGTRIETITLKTAPEGMLKAMPRLTSVEWTASEKMPEGRIAEAGNPNLLLWVNDDAYAPADAANIVVGGNAETIYLTAGYPFNAPRPFKADYIELTKEFNQKTELGKTSGWETLAIPFAPTKIEHKEKGEIKPFGAPEIATGEAKPFWLYEATETGWQKPKGIEAGVPYIISMPNNKEYVEAFNLNGTIIFSAESVDIGPEESQPRAANWKNGMIFTATFMPVEGNFLSLNSEGSEDGDILPGSHFISEAKTLPFGAYIANQQSRRRVPIFGDQADMVIPTITPSGVVVEVLGNGKIRITSGRDFIAEIYTPTGMRVRSVKVAAGETVEVSDLAKGLYLVAGSKIMVN